MIKNSVDYVVFIDATNCNPNGDPDNDNYSRMDIQTEKGYMSSDAIKRKIRDRAYLISKIKGNPILNYIATDDLEYDKVYLSAKQKEAIDSISEKVRNKELKINSNIVLDYMCSTYYDIRTFGAVCSGFSNSSLLPEDLKKDLAYPAKKASGIHGAVQVSYFDSLDKIFRRSDTLTRIIVETKEEFLQKDKFSTMGNVKTIPYGLYRGEISINKNLARITGFSEDDLQLLEDSLKTLYEGSLSSSKMGMCVRRIYRINRPENDYTLQSKVLCELITAEKNSDVEYPRKFSDYTVRVDFDTLKNDEDYKGCEIIQIL